jgi:hypothetical protein
LEKTPESGMKELFQKPFLKEWNMAFNTDDSSVGKK